ncbi:hypothetical protein UFOVP253_56 [uncultured Caudovirales phage]|uniref:Scaffolding protein n=1 Tax=uncultured Caudovirales phage TaxID=2100421 RepID=A0A6J5LDG8_9CAUD|nr:hypothetical protein UFOVP253_56 [uncultured Caudovirales phage]
MADQQLQAPTQEQLDANKAAVDAENARWQGDFKEEDLIIPYKREENDENKDNKGDSDKKADDTNTNDEELEVTYEAPAPVVTASDPGTFTPGDYSFEVTLKDGKSVKISTPEEADKIADDPDNFETPRQLSDFLKKSLTMSNKLERDREKYEADKKLYDEQTETAKQRQETVDSLSSELNYLVSKGLMPKIDAKYVNADWTDPAVASQPGVKEQIALLNYMVKENEVRMKAGVKPITSGVDAFNAWKLENAGKEAQDEAKAAGEARKVASARVAGSSPAQQGSFVPKGIAVGRVMPQRGAAVWDN